MEVIDLQRVLDAKKAASEANQRVVELNVGPNDKLILTCSARLAAEYRKELETKAAELLSSGGRGLLILEYGILPLVLKMNDA
jgi:hypothetical protein